jgi:hypothetical protein
MMLPIFKTIHIQKLFGPITAFFHHRRFYMDHFLSQRLRKLRLEFQELLGMLSIKELTTNFRLTNNYQMLHQALVKL